MSKIVRNKEQITATVPPYLKKRCNEIAEGSDFTSVSDIVTQALSEFITKYDERKAREAKEYEDYLLKEIILSFKKSKEGNDLIESFFTFYQEPSTNMEESKIKNELLKYIKAFCLIKSIDRPNKELSTKMEESKINDKLQELSKAMGSSSKKSHLSSE